MKAEQFLPSWLGTPTPTVPPAPEHFDASHMTMAPAAAQRLVANMLLAQGASLNTAAAAGRKVARFVDDYSTYPPNVYQRVLRNVFTRTQDFERAKAAGRQASALSEAFDKK